MESLKFRTFSSAIGEILVAGSGQFVTHIRRDTDRPRLIAQFLEDYPGATPDTDDFIQDACRAVKDYLQGRNRTIRIAVETGGTEFQRKVWKELSAIAYGETASYSEIAERIGAPRSFRAVANACGDNPVPLIIPCHRAVHKDGAATGFAWGREVKRYLLEIEKPSARMPVAA